jgi:hypothetical protein
MLDFLNPLLNRHPERVKANVELYTWQTCPYCIRAKMLLWWKGINFEDPQLHPIKSHKIYPSLKIGLGVFKNYCESC